jgi:cytochrome c5
MRLGNKMSTQDNTKANKPIINVVMLVALFIGLLAALTGFYTLITYASKDAVSSENIKNYIKPVAVVEMSANGGVHVAQSGEDVVKGICVACHGAGVLGSPKLGDKAQWAPRIAQGYDVLVQHAINGIRSMPARGGNAELTDEEVAAAVAVMANQSGADFKVASAAK